MTDQHYGPESHYEGSIGCVELPLIDQRYNPRAVTVSTDIAENPKGSRLIGGYEGVKLQNVVSHPVPVESGLVHQHRCSHPFP
jgi:hypothetical protein